MNIADFPVASLSNALLTILTGIYVILTYLLVRHTKAAREPSAFVDFEVSENSVHLIIGNSSDAPALNVSFKVNKTIPWENDEDGISKIEALQQGFPFIAPRRMLKFYAGCVCWDKLDATNYTATVHIAFDNEARHRFFRDYHLDIHKFAAVAGDSFQDSSAQVVAKAIRDAESSRRREEMMKSVTRAISFRPQTKTCPYCSKSIPAAAKKCHECHEFLPAERETTPQS